MKSLRFLFVAGMAATPAFAQSVEEATFSQSPQIMPPIVVTGVRVERSSLAIPASIDALGASEIQEGRPLVNLSESLGRVPGLIVQNRHNYAQDLQISSRGFGARATFGIRGIRLIIDDIPATMPDGQGQASSINLGSTDRLEVLRGPFSAIYGNSSGGVIQVFTEDGPPQATLTPRFMAGSHHSWRVETKMAGENSGGLNYVGDLSRFHSHGYRDHSVVTRDQGNVKLRYRPGENSKLTFVANYLYQPDTQDPLGLTRNQVESNPRQVDPSAVIFNTRKRVENAQSGVVYERDMGDADTLRFIGYAGIRQVLQFLALTRGAQIPPTSSGGVVDLDRAFNGAGVRWTRRTSGDAPLTLIAGLDYDSFKERRRGYENFVGDAVGVMGALRRDEDDSVRSIDPYLQAEWRIAPQWLISAGVRHSEVKFESQDFFVAAGNPDDSGNVRYRHVSPVLGVLYAATPSVSLYGNYGRGFETPTFAELAYRPDGSSGLNFDLKPSTSHSVELGLKSLLGVGGRLNLAFYTTRANNEITPAANAGGRSTFQNASKTLRRGVELSWDVSFPNDLSGYAAYTYLDATFKEGFSYRPSVAPAFVTVPVGAAIPGVPRHAAYAELAWRNTLPGFSAAVEIAYRDKIFVNDVNSEAAGSYVTANARVGYKKTINGWDFATFLRIDNMTDRKYIGSVIVNESNGRYYEPAPQRTAMAAMSISYAF